MYLESRQAIYSSPHAGAIANKLLRKCLAPTSNYECVHTPGLWWHVTRPIQFTLVVDDFGLKYIGNKHVEHLIKALKKDYKLAKDWESNLYCGITLDWNYEEGYLDISIPGCTEKLIQRVRHEKPKKPQHNPYQDPPQIFGTSAQNTVLPKKSAELDERIFRRVQQVISGIPYYNCAVDITVLPALGTIVCAQSQATKITKKKVSQLLDYLATKPNEKKTVSVHPAWYSTSTQTPHICPNHKHAAVFLAIFSLATHL